MAFGQLIEELETQLRVEELNFARCEVIIKELKVYSNFSHLNMSKVFFSEIDL